MRVLGLCSYPIEAAATRYRIAQFVEPLAEKGIYLEISSFLDSRQFASLYRRNIKFSALIGLLKPALRRVLEASRPSRYDLIFVQREAMFFGPGVFEWMFQKIGNVPMILDLDDATYLSYESPTFGKTGSFFKFFGKTDRLIRRADVVICGNRLIAEHVEKCGADAVIIPTIVDNSRFVPVEKNNEIPIIGWIGTHSTFPLLESIFPVLQELSKRHQFVLKIVGAGRDDIAIEGVRVENIKWNLDREIADFQSLDIGLYPLATSKSASLEWIRGKSGFKAIQYLAVGIPFVMTPIGVGAEIGEANVTHFNALSAEDWYDALQKLVEDSALRKSMGINARNYSLRHFGLAKQTEKLHEVFLRCVQDYN